MSELPNGFKETQIGILPSEWQLATIGRLFDIQQGKALSPKSRNGISPHSFLRTANVLWGKLDLTKVDAMDFTEQEVERLALRSGDLLVCEGGDIGRTAIWRTEMKVCCHQNHVHRLRAKDSDVEPEFYMYWMQAAILLLGLYGGEGNKTTIPNLSQARLSAFRVPLPPLPEQRAIAHVLNTIQRAIAAQDAVIAAAREVEHSLMQRLFTYGPYADPLPTKETEIGEVPEMWQVMRLGDMAELITKGSSPNWQGFEYRDDGIVFVRSQNVGWGRLELSEVAFLPEEFNRKERKSVIRRDDLLMNIVGASIGRAALASATVDGGNLNQAVALVRLNHGYDPRFVMNFMLTESGQAQQHRQKKEIARANLSLQDIGNLLVPVPPLEQQRNIAEVLATADSKIENEESRKLALQAMFKSMLHQLMTGQVRVR